MKHVCFAPLYALVILLSLGCGDETNSTSPVDSQTTVPEPTEFTDAMVPPDDVEADEDIQEEDAGLDEDSGFNPEDGSGPEDGSASGDDGGVADSSTEEDASPEEIAEWPYGGPHPVGVTTPDESIVTPSGRELKWMIWYPAQLPTDEDATPHKYLQLMEGTAYLDAEPALGGPWPIILFSHGNQGIKEQSFFLTEHLASHGYLVVAPDHKYNTALDFSSEKLSEVSIERPKDISSVLDRVLAPTESDPEWLEGFGDPDHVGVTGHSFGGYTSLLVGGTNAFIPEELVEECQETGGWICDLIENMGTDPLDLSDERVGASLPMAPAGYEIFTDAGLAENQVPTMVMAGSTDQLTPLVSTTEPIYSGLPAPKYMWTIEGGDHYIFSDLCKIPGIETLTDFGDFQTACGEQNPVPHAELHPHINDAALAFFNLYLMEKEDEAGVLTPDGAQNAHPNISLMSELE